MAAVIRRLGAADLPAYKALRDEMLERYPQAFTSDAATERVKSPDAYLQRLGLDRSDGGHSVIGAWAGERLLGAIGCERDPRASVRHIGHVIGMMVRADVQRRGVGRALLDALIGGARQSPGIEMLTLTVTAGNQAAIGLYERVGFRRVGTLPRAIRVGGRYHDKHQYVLML
ncbi:GNAT family N-acetyltransferase [Piscinibacter koreensis]|uniref:GNAT family N-acetyltransferase n=1 Tax=Piscinibacter koreensis TaxID=2742824 RepID=A0A7Y6NN56_9BURK|nr:GNAT family N-acetyltransferase [Schlegelella koreensis]NUZ06225.1 GNAT family N-acetyltransferase [Schlegelella koreensis]